MARLILETASGRLEVEDSATIGRAAENDLVLDDPLVSRQHARVERVDDGTYLLIDLGSSNGTRVGGRPLRAAVPLQSGDVAEIGEAQIRITIEGAREVGPPPDITDQTVRDGQPPAGRSMIGQSASMLEVFNLIGVAAKSELPVLIEGETGTGKELTARAIHEASARARKPFLALNCATLVEGLLESELFGHRKGAFTGADRDHEGLFESVGGGTVFLDEIGEMPVSTQPKLLRVLEEGEVVRVGETEPRPIEARIISATNRNLEQAVESGAFRRDLFFRLATFPMSLPPLREREGDIPLLARHAVSVAAQATGKRVRGITEKAGRLLEEHVWPGNARELRNEIQRAVELVGSGESIDERHLSERVRRGAAGGPAVVTQSSDRSVTPDPAATSDLAATSDGGEVGDDLRAARAAFEVDHILKVFNQNRGHVGKTAAALGLSRAGLYKKLKEYGIDP